MTDRAPGRKIIGGPVYTEVRLQTFAREIRQGGKAEAEIISRRGVCSVIYYVAKRAIKVNSAVPASSLLSRSLSFFPALTALFAASSVVCPGEELLRGIC